jgi:glycyl-tRNA synthetase beta chain
MVGEFPELQGLMGSYYAGNDGETALVADALREFYLPRFAGDAIPSSAVGRCVAYADKVDTLVGIFAVGSAPSGDKDPFALRRTALGCLRIAVESAAPVGIAESLSLACDGYANVVGTDDIPPVITKFLLDRLRGYFAEQKIPGSVVESVLAVRPNQPLDIRQRIDGEMSFRELEESEMLTAANKRISNILRKNGGNGGAVFNRALLQEPAELALADEMESIREDAERFSNDGDHTSYLRLLAQLNVPINTFFDEVMVICKDTKLRANRIGMLSRINDLFSRVADVARLND